MICHVGYVLYLNCRFCVACASLLMLVIGSPGHPFFELIFLVSFSLKPQSEEALLTHSLCLFLKCTLPAHLFKKQIWKTLNPPAPLPPAKYS